MSSSPPALDNGPLPASDWEVRHARRLGRACLALVAVGLLWRLTRYFLRFPIWGDEAMLLNNYFTRSYADIFGPIDYFQIAPLLYHWANIAVLHTLGSSELAVRLPPLLASVASLGLFARLAWLTLPPLGRSLAVAILAVSIWPATMGSLCKPYTFDLFFSLLLLVPAVSWLQCPQRLWPLVALTLVVGVAVLASYPAVFVAGAVAVALLRPLWRGGCRRGWALFAIYISLLLGSFVFHYLMVGRPHMASSTNGVSTGECMSEYWQNGFPPASPLSLCWWLLTAHTGQVAAYPIGSATGGSVVTVGLCCAGLAVLWRQRRRDWLVLLAATFGLWFAAAVLRKYPYGASCRLAQHVAPFYCLLAGLGAATLLLRLPEQRRQRGVAGAFALLLLIGAVGVGRDVVKPYRDVESRWSRQLAAGLLERSAGAPIALSRQLIISPPLVWYLLRANRPYGTWGDATGRAAWLDEVDAEQARRHGSLWLVEAGSSDPDWVRQKLGPGWRCVQSQGARIEIQGRRQPVVGCCLDYWVRSADSSVASGGPDSRLTSPPASPERHP